MSSTSPRQQLIDLDLIAHRSPLYQVLALPGTVAAPRPAPRALAITRKSTTGGQPVSLATQLLHRRPWPKPVTIQSRGGAAPWRRD